MLRGSAGRSSSSSSSTARRSATRCSRSAIRSVTSVVNWTGSSLSGPIVPFAVRNSQRAARAHLARSVLVIGMSALCCLYRHGMGTCPRQPHCEDVRHEQQRGGDLLGGAVHAVFVVGGAGCQCLLCPQLRHLRDLRGVLLDQLQLVPGSCFHGVSVLPAGHHPGTCPARACCAGRSLLLLRAVPVGPGEHGLTHSALG